MRSSALTLLTLAFALVGAGCSTRAVTPPRPALVPRSATWVGGLDGGSWIECVPAGARFSCVVYQDGTGAITAKGTFTLRPAGADRTLTYEYFDGETIGLAGARRLVPEGRSPRRGRPKRRLFRFPTLPSLRLNKRPGASSIRALALEAHT